MCISPLAIKSKGTKAIEYQYSTYSVPCGKCYECKMRRSSQWAFRLSIEEKQHSLAYFATFTYSDENIPVYGSLVKSDLQKYFKRLRKSLVKSRVKYYACGEYGTNTQRPHYHAIIFGAPAEEIVNAWQAGHVYLGDVNQASISYVCGYVNKPHIVLRPDDVRQREFQLISKGLGEAYLTDAAKKWHHDNNAGYVVEPGGKKVAIPRYYRDKMFDDAMKKKLAGEALLKHELDLLDGIRKKGGFEKYERDRNEAVKAAIIRQKFNQSKRKNL